MSSYRHLLSDREQQKKTIFHLIEKIVIDNETICVYVDLKKYFNIPNKGYEDLILCITEDRNLVANKPKHQEIQFSGVKIKKGFDKLKNEF